MWAQYWRTAHFAIDRIGKQNVTNSIPDVIGVMIATRAYLSSKELCDCYQTMTDYAHATDGEEYNSFIS